MLAIVVLNPVNLVGQRALDIGFESVAQIGWAEQPVYCNDRYSGFSLGFHFASITAGGPAPLIATALLAWTGSGYVIALYILLSAAVTFVSAMFLPDRTNRDISQEVA